MAEDTAVLVAPDTAAGEVTPPQDTAPETEPQAVAPETEAAQAPETEDAPPADPLEALAAETLKEHPKVKELLDAEVRAREHSWRESERRKAEAQAQAHVYDQRLEQATTMARETAQRQIAAALKAVEDGRVDGQRAFNALAPLSGAMANAIAIEQVDTMRGLAFDYVGDRFPDYRPSNDVVEYVTRAWHSGDPNTMLDSVFTLLGRAAAETLAPRLRAQAEAEIRARNEAAQKTEGIKAARAANIASSPTDGLSPTSSTQRSPREILDSTSPADPAFAKAFVALHGTDAARAAGYA